MRLLPEGVCFVHGPYRNSDGKTTCPKWPECAQQPQQQEHIDYANKRSKYYALIRAAEVLETEGLASEVVVMLRGMAKQFDQYK